MMPAHRSILFFNPKFPDKENAAVQRNAVIMMSATTAGNENNGLENLNGMFIVCKRVLSKRVKKSISVKFEPICLGSLCIVVSTMTFF